MPKNWIAGPQNPVGPEPKNPGAAKYPNFVKRSGPERWLRQFPSEGATPPAGGGGGTGGGGGGGTIATATTPGIVKPGTGMTVAADGTITYTLSPATTAALGGVKQGANIVIAPDGTISANFPGAVNFKGVTDVTIAPTGTYDPTTAQRGDMWIASTGGAANAAWTGLTTVTKDAMVIYEGTKWDLAGDVGASVKPDWAAAAGAADEILNKPNVLPKSDWTAVPGDPAEILNKPTIVVAPPVLAQIHVETAGDDTTADGTAAKPFATIEKALTYLSDSTDGQGAHGTISKVKVGAGAFPSPNFKKFPHMTISIEGAKKPANPATTLNKGSSAAGINAVADAAGPALNADATLTRWNGSVDVEDFQSLELSNVAVTQAAFTLTAGSQARIWMHDCVLGCSTSVKISLYDGGNAWTKMDIVTKSLTTSVDAACFLLLYSTSSLNASKLKLGTKYGGVTVAYINAVPLTAITVPKSTTNTAGGPTQLLGKTSGGYTQAELTAGISGYNEHSQFDYIGDGGTANIVGGTWT